MKNMIIFIIFSIFFALFSLRHLNLNVIFYFKFIQVIYM